LSYTRATATGVIRV